MCADLTTFVLADGLVDHRLRSHVLAGQTTRLHAQGVSQPPFAQFNLALHVGDDAVAVQHNRIQLLKDLANRGINQLVWLNQVHGVAVYDADAALSLDAPTADAVISSEQGVACVIMTADCLPIVLTDTSGRVVGCVHAGWRGLLAGVIEQTVMAMQERVLTLDQAAHVINNNPAAPVTLHAWFGAAIGASVFEVGAEVYDAFMLENNGNQYAFVRQSNGKYLADLYALARLRLTRAGVTYISGGEHCTVLQADQFYSYRAAAPTHQTGRMATLIALCPINHHLS